MAFKKPKLTVETEWDISKQQYVARIRGIPKATFPYRRTLGPFLLGADSSREAEERGQELLKDVRSALNGAEDTVRAEKPR